jgi:hypothetical protein
MTTEARLPVDSRARNTVVCSFEVVPSDRNDVAARRATPIAPVVEDRDLDLAGRRRRRPLALVPTKKGPQHELARRPAVISLAVPTGRSANAERVVAELRRPPSLVEQALPNTSRRTTPIMAPTTTVAAFIKANTAVQSRGVRQVRQERRRLRRRAVRPPWATFPPAPRRLRAPPSSPAPFPRSPR